MSSIQAMAPINSTHLITLDIMLSLNRNTSMLTQAHYLTNFSDSLLPVLVLIVTQPTQVQPSKMTINFRFFSSQMLLNAQIENLEKIHCLNYHFEQDLLNRNKRITDFQVFFNSLILITLMLGFFMKVKPKPNYTGNSDPNYK